MEKIARIIGVGIINWSRFDKILNSIETSQPDVSNAKLLLLCYLALFGNIDDARSRVNGIVSELKYITLESTLPETHTK